MDQDLLKLKNEELQQKNGELESRVDELEAELKERPTQEDLDDLQRQNTELQSQVVSEEELDELGRLAKQGEIYVDLLRDEAKSAFRAKLISDGVDKHDVELHPEYLSHCRDVDETDDIEMLQRSAESDYKSARSDHAWRISQSLISLKNKKTPKVRFSLAGLK